MDKRVGGLHEQTIANVAVAEELRNKQTQSERGKNGLANEGSRVLEGATGRSERIERRSRL